MRNGRIQFMGALEHEPTFLPSAWMNRLIVVSNRLPFALDSSGEDLWTVTPAVGGLVSAVEPVLRERGGTWIGGREIAGKIPNKPLATAIRNAGYNIVPVALSETERD